MSGDSTVHRAFGLRLEHILSNWLEVGTIGINLWAQISEVSEYRGAQIISEEGARILLLLDFGGGGYKHSSFRFQYDVIECWLSLFFKDKTFL